MVFVVYSPEVELHRWRHCGTHCLTADCEDVHRVAIVSCVRYSILVNLSGARNSYSELRGTQMTDISYLCFVLIICFCTDSCYVHDLGR